jgi:3'(2'), 5'-bisphosphate nucleotidase
LLTPTAVDHTAAAEIATLAGRRLMELRSTDLEGASLKDAGDAAAHSVIVDELARRFPDDGVLSEEGRDDTAGAGDTSSRGNTSRLDVRRVWIVDPLDGTREFSERPRTDWAVHVALCIDGEVVAGAVALPARDLTLATGCPLPAAGPAPTAPRVVVSRTRPTEHALRIVEQLGGELVPMGSAGAKAMAVVLGDADVYAHSGGQYEWDSAAPVAVAAAAGLHVSRLDGSPLLYNRPDPWLPDVLICRPELAASVIEICREA